MCSLVLLMIQLKKPASKSVCWYSDVHSEWFCYILSPPALHIHLDSICVSEHQRSFSSKGQKGRCKCSVYVFVKKKKSCVRHLRRVSRHKSRLASAIKD